MLNYVDLLPTFFQFSDIDVSKSTISDSPSESFPSSPGSSFKYFPSCDEEGMDSVSIFIISRLPSCNSFTAFTCSNNFVTESSDAEAKKQIIFEIIGLKSFYNFMYCKGRILLIMYLVHHGCLQQTICLDVFCFQDTHTLAVTQRTSLE